MADSAGLSVVKKFFSAGFPLEWWHHVVLTGIVPGIMILPYILSQFYSSTDTTGMGIVVAIISGIFGIPFTFGSNGIHLLVSNSIPWAAVTAVLNLGFVFFGQLLTYRNFGSWSPFFKFYGAIFQFANPFMVFSILQVFNPNFYNEKYKWPFLNKFLSSLVDSKGVLIKGKVHTANDIGFIPIDATTKKPSKDSVTGKYIRQYGTMGALSIGATLLLLIPAFSNIMKYLPAPWQASIANSLGSAFSTLTVIAAVFGGGGGIFALTKLSSLFSSPAAASARGGATTPAPEPPASEPIPEAVPVPEPAPEPAPAPAPEPAPQEGGGSEIPSIIEAAKELINGFEPNVNSQNQSGGGNMTDTESALFVGIIGAIAAMGATLAAFRKKDYSFPTV